MSREAIIRQKSQGRAVLMAHTVSLAPEQQPEQCSPSLRRLPDLVRGIPISRETLRLRPRDVEQSLEAESTKVHGRRVMRSL